MAAERPNVILLVFDAARRDAFEPYGAPREASPAFVDLTRRGAALPNAYAAGCWTIPSHAAMLTGLLPREAGLSRAPGARPAGCRPVLEGHRGRLLAEVLRTRGYRTAAVSTNLWLTETSGFSIGFDEFVTIDTRRQMALGDRSRAGRRRRTIEALRARADDGARAAARTFAGWIEPGPRRPFFWFANLVEAHSPYLPPKPYNPLGPIGRVRAAEEAGRHLTMGEVWRACAGGFDVPAEALERMRALYAGAIRALDDWLAELLQRLDHAGILDETLVIVTADHGENFGEEGRMGHGFSLDQRLIHVPFGWAGPGAEPIERAVSLAAIPALIGAAASIADHPWAGEPSLATGIACAQLDTPTGPEDPRVQQAVDEWGLGAEAARVLTEPLTSATDGRWKLVRGEREGERAYDLLADPAGRDPFEAGRVPPDSLANLRAAVDRASPPASVSAPGSVEEPDEAERRQLEERMRLLGYL